MSAYIVEQKTVNRIITFLMYPPSDYSTTALQEPLEKLCFFLSSRDSKKHALHLGKRLMELNFYAVKERYGDNVTQEECDCIRNYEFSREPVSPVQAMKSLRCFLYQAYEGDADETALFKAMERIKANIAIEIVENMPEMASAEWG